MLISPYEPRTHLSRIPIRECGELLVPFLEECPLLLLDRPRYDYERIPLLRAGVVERLCKAAEWLLPIFRLSVIEGWRSIEMQCTQYTATEKRLRAEHPQWPESTLRRMVNRLSAPPDGPGPAPHTTGGAVDLWLCDPDGVPLDLSAPYSAADDRSFPTSVRGLTMDVLLRRQLMREALEASGLTNYPSEYWHWSYGDQGWAYRGGHEWAVYGAVGP